MSSNGLLHGAICEQTAPLPPPPLDSSLGCWLFPTVLSSNTSTKLHGGGRGGKATFFSFEVSKMPEALKRENCRN